MELARVLGPAARARACLGAYRGEVEEAVDEDGPASKAGIGDVPG